MAERKTQAGKPDKGDIDRRQRRSEVRSEALRLQLEYVMERLGLSAMVLCDDIGEVVASCGEEESVQELAIQAPWLFVTPQWELQSALAFLWQSFPGLKEHNIALLPLEVEDDDGSTLYIAGVGDSSYLDAWIEHAAEGVKRIFSNTIN